MNKIDKNYFLNYGGKGITYKESWKKYFGGSPRYVKNIINELKLYPNSCYDVGSGTGEALKAFKDYFGFTYVGGCEINSWAFRNVIEELNIVHGDFLKITTDKTYDIVLANLTMYIPINSLDLFFDKLRKIGHRKTIYLIPIHYDASDGFWWVTRSGRVIKETGDTRDKYKSFSRPYIWWANYIRKAGFSIVSEDKYGVFYIMKYKKSLRNKKEVIIFPTPEDVVKEKMFNKRSPFFIKFKNNIFKFFWDASGIIIIEYGDIVEQSRPEFIKYIYHIILEKHEMPAVSIILRPIKEFKKVSEYFRLLKVNNVFYPVFNSNINGTYLTDAYIVSVIKRNYERKI